MLMILVRTLRLEETGNVLSHDTPCQLRAYVCQKVVQELGREIFLPQVIELITDPAVQGQIPRLG
jgi:hypothetical protein